MAETTAGFDDLVSALRSAGEPTRLRLLALLAAGEATVKDLTEVLAQSQPRVSRHLKLMSEAGLIRRLPEGAWAYYRVAEEGPGAETARAVLARLDPADPVVAGDRGRLAAIKAAHAAEAQAYFARNAARWDRLRSLHVAEDAVEAAIRKAVGPRPVQSLLDLGTGTGRILTLLSDLYVRGVGVDASHDMLSVARANLAAAGIGHAHVRQGDVTALSLGAVFDLVVVHQVLHYLDDPGRAIREAAAAVAPGGRLLVVDFAPHGLEFLRVEHAHRRLGFSREQMAAWIGAAGLDKPEVVDLPPPAGREADGLTVTLWLARDRRIQMADQPVLLQRA